jgi:hypothetical protein
MAAVAENGSAQKQTSVVDAQIYADIADALVKRNLDEARKLMDQLCALKGPEHVARALTLGGPITSRVRRTAKRLYKSRDDQKRSGALNIVATLVEVWLYAPSSVVKLNPRVGYARI